MAQVKTDTTGAQMKRQITAYSCRNCHNPLGNDDFLIPNMNAKVILVSQLDNAVMGINAITSNETSDRDCAYREVQCAKCFEVVGRHYHSVTEKLPLLLNNFGLSIIAIETATVHVALTKDQEVQQKLDDLACLVVDASLDRLRIKQGIEMLASLVASNKHDIEQLQAATKGENTPTRVVDDMISDTGSSEHESTTIIKTNKK